MKSAFILGSCVTRDCFEVPGAASLRCSDYFARTSLVSIMAPARPLDVEFTAPNNFARKAICRDFDKSFFAAVENADFDIFVVDFVDERFPLLEYEDTFVTQSHEMERSGLMEALPLRSLGRFSERVDRLWQDAGLLFARRLEVALRGRPVVIHRAVWAEKYQSKSGEIIPFDGKWGEKISAHNRILNAYYDFMKSHLPEAIEVSVAPEYTIADEGHKWGLHAIHYLPGYYSELYRRLEAVLQEQGRRRLPLLARLSGTRR